MIIRVIESLGSERSVKFFKTFERARNSEWKYARFCENGIFINSKLNIVHINEQEYSISIYGIDRTTNLKYSFDMEMIKNFDTKRNYFYVLELINDGYIFQQYFSNSEIDCRNYFDQNIGKIDGEKLNVINNSLYWRITKYKFSRGNDMRKECFKCPFMKE